MKTIKFTVLTIFTTFLMGSSFAVVKMGLPYSSPLLLAALRFILAGIVMAVIVISMKRPHPTSRISWIKLFGIGSLQTAGVMGCIFLSLRTISASESSILTFTNPLLVVVFGTLFFKTRYKFYQWIGVLLGMIGVIITMGAQIKFEIGNLRCAFSGILGIRDIISETVGRQFRYVGIVNLSNAVWRSTAFSWQFSI
ncbi:drug/metabolite transporter (DMT)-like permease [Sporosarcina luteola]|nr:drug/metabolite transporter (DMT)-like permease [Sporosarcina luteola]